MNLLWDPEIDTPATIAVIGGGPAGVEAALYARFLGYFVELYDSAKVGDSLLAYGDRPINAAWSEVCSNLGLAALEAQGVALPSLEERPTYRQYVEQYLLPVARTDLLYDSIHINSPVRSVSRLGCLLGDELTIERRAEQEFRVLLSSSQRGEHCQIVDIVLDCSGRNLLRQGMASGGGESVGMGQAAAEIRVGKCDVLGKLRTKYAGKKTLVFGNDLAACINAIELSQLAESGDGTQLMWVLPKQIQKTTSQFRLPERSDCDLTSIQQGCENLVTTNQSSHIVTMMAWGIEALVRQGERWNVTLQLTEEDTVEVEVDEIINCARGRNDWTFATPLDVMQQDKSSLLTPEPHYYLLGQKSSPAGCTIRQIQDQVREVFGLIGGRKELNLYETVKPQSI